MAAASLVASVMTPGDDELYIYKTDRWTAGWVARLRRMTELYGLDADVYITISEPVGSSDVIILIVRDSSDAQSVNTDH